MTLIKLPMQGDQRVRVRLELVLCALLLLIIIAVGDTDRCKRLTIIVAMVDCAFAMHAQANVRAIAL